MKYRSSLCSVAKNEKKGRATGRKINLFPSYVQSSNLTAQNAEILAQRALGLAPVAAARIWLDRLGTVNHSQVWSILERVPAARMSDLSKRFTFELLVTNQQRLLEPESLA